MNINPLQSSMMSRAENTTGTEEGTGTTPEKTDALADKTAFLQLLIAQIKNQDPLNPADGVTFLTQLAQFSQLEQLMGIRSDLKAIADEKATESGSSNTTVAA